MSLDTLRNYQYKKTKDKEEKDIRIARQRTRKGVELEWRRAIQHEIEKYQAFTVADLAACLGVNPSPKTPHERTQLRELYRRLEKGALHGRYRALYEYDVQSHGKAVPKAKQRTHAGRVFYVSLKFPRNEQGQYEHKAGITHIRATLDRAFKFDTFKTDVQLREEAKEKKSALIYDFYAEVEKEALCVEYALTTRPGEISEKCQDWLTIFDRLKKEDLLTVESYRYLWVAETEAKAYNIRDRWLQDGLKSGRLLVTWQDQFSPFRPESIVEPIWLWPVDQSLQVLRRTQ
jgi:hypothetical protein